MDVGSCTYFTFLSNMLVGKHLWELVKLSTQVRSMTFQVIYNYLPPTGIGNGKFSSMLLFT